MEALDNAQIYFAIAQEANFIRHAGVLKQIRISLHKWMCLKCNNLAYIVYKFG